MSYEHPRHFTLYDYTIVNVERLEDPTLPESRVLAGGRFVDADDRSPEQFADWILARWVSEYGGGLSDEELKYLRVYAMPLNRWDKPPLFFREDRLEELRGIRDRLDWTVRLPASGMLAGPLNAFHSEFGDEFFNFPAFFGKRPPGDGTKLSGFVIVQFDEPGDVHVDFDLQFLVAGGPNRIVWGGGQVYTFFRNRAFPVPPWVPGLPKENGGRLNLITGEVTDLRLSSIFQNTTIGKVDRTNWIAFAFPFIYPPLPLGPPPGVTPPETEGKLDFTLDGDGAIVSMNLASKSLAFVTLFPFLPPDLSPFPPFSFGPGGAFYFANPDECEPGTEVCPTNEDNPDGIQLPLDAFFNPHLDLVVDRFFELPGPPPPPLCAPQAVADAVLVAAGGRLALLGGETANGVSDAVRWFDPRFNTWSDGPAVPKGVTAAQGAAHGGEVFLFGGREDLSGSPCAYTQILDLGSGTWRQGKKLPSAVASGTAAAVGDRIYVIGGLAGNNQAQNLVQIYDPAGNSWSDGAPLPDKLAEAAAAVRDGEIYVVGGRTTASKLSNRVWIYDPGADDWRKGPNTVLGTPVSELPALIGSVAGSVGETLFQVGGRAERDGVTVAACHHFDPDQGEHWAIDLSATLPVAGSAAAVLGGTLFVVGGRVQTGAEPAPGRLSDAVQAFHPGLPWGVCPAPLITSAGVLNAAALSVGPGILSPGSLALVLGSNLGVDPAKVSITVGGQPAPVLAPLPINGQPLVEDGFFFLVPQVGDGLVELTLVREDAPDHPASVDVAVAPAAPGLFIYSFLEAREPDFLTRSPALACNEDGTVNCPKQPATPGQKLTLFATGLGTGDPEEIAKHLDVRFGDKTKKAEVLAVEPATGLPPGVFKVHVEVPAKPGYSNNVLVTAKLGETSNEAVVSIREEAFRPDPPIPCEVGIQTVFPPLPG